MLEFLPYLLIALLTANTTVQLPVPIQVEVGGGTNHASPIPVDTATLSGLVAIGGGLVYKWRQSNNRDKVGVETDMKVANSLKQTDKGIAESLTKIHEAVAKIPGVPEEVKTLIKSEADSWHKDNTAYYDKSTPNLTTDLSKDPVIKTSGEIQKQTEPTVND